MKIRILSDLHIEFSSFDVPSLEHDYESVLVLAGDIGVIYKKQGLYEFLSKVSKQFKAIVYVPGNHEYYKGIWPESIHILREWNLPENIYVVDRDVVCIDGIAFVCCTLWSSFDDGCLASMQESAKTLNDYIFIETNIDGHDTPRPVLPEDQLADHKESVAWLDKTLTKLSKSYKCVMVTHHGISRRSIHARFADSNVNGAFVTDCEWLLKKHAPALAIHGHVHNSFDYYVSDGELSTRVIVNPRGYMFKNGEMENPEFNPNLVVEI